MDMHEKNLTKSIPRIRIDLRDIHRLDHIRKYHADVSEDTFEDARAKILFIPSTHALTDNEIHRVLVLCDATVLMGQGIGGTELPIAQQVHQMGKLDCVVMIALGDYLVSPKGKPSDFPVSSPAPALVFWLGYLTATFGRRRVIVLHEDGPYFKCPTNYFEVAYIPFDPDGRWKISLSQHFKSLGIRVNENPSVDAFFGRHSVHQVSPSGLAA